MLTRIGDIEIWRILELNGPFMPPEKLFPTAGPDVAQVIDDHSPGTICAETGKLIIPVQAFLLKTPQAIILVDACVGNDKTNEGHLDWHRLQGTRFMAGLTAAGVTPGIRLAAPSVAGRAVPSFSRISLDRPPIRP